MAVITISRGTFSGGRRLAACLGRHLGYRVVSREVLGEAAKRYGVREEELLRGLQQAPTFWERFGAERHLYLAVITATLSKLALEDSLVYHGHAGQFLLPGVGHVLRLRVIAPMSQRVREACAAHGFGEREAEAYVRARDQERSAWTRFLYGVDWQDPSLYDVVLNLERLGVEGACLAVAGLVEQPEYRLTTEGLALLRDLYLGHHVRARLFLNPRLATAAARIEVQAKAGVVRLSGVLPGADLVAAAIATVEAIPEVQAVETDWLGSRVPPQ